jgi:hypothetical protein
MEDPFAIHLLVQSADKLLIDFTKKSGQELRMDWEIYIKPEYHTAFFEKHRAIYNYFKHADRDFGADLPVHDIMMLNIMTLFHLRRQLCHRLQTSNQSHDAVPNVCYGSQAPNHQR